MPKEINEIIFPMPLKEAHMFLIGKAGFGNWSRIHLLALFLAFVLLGGFCINRSHAAINEWTQIDPPSDFQVGCIATDPANPNTLYMGGACHGVYKSTNDGESWSAINQGLPFPGSGSCTVICSLVVDPSRTSTIYFGWMDLENTPTGGLVKSVDGGSSWNRVESGLSCNQVLSLAVDPQNSATLYAGTPCGVFKSTNGGGGWVSSNSGLTGLVVEALAVDPRNSATVYAATVQGVFKSLNGGGSWVAGNSDWNFEHVRALVIDPQNSSVLYAGTSAGVFKCLDGGRTWAEMNTRLSGRVVAALAIDPQDTRSLYAWTDGGVFKAQLGDVSAAQGATSSTSGISIVASTEPTSQPRPIVAVNCGGPQYTDQSGIVYSADTGSTGGQTYSTQSPIAGTEDDVLYQTERYGTFSYKFRVPNGNYLVTLKFAEIYAGAAGQRIFGVKIEGKEVIGNLDIFSNVGKNTALDRTIPVTVADGELNIDFYASKNNAKINAILVTPQPGTTSTVSSTPTTSPQGGISAQSSSVSGAVPQTAASEGAAPASSVSTTSTASTVTASASTSAAPYDSSEFLRCTFDNTVTCGSLSPMQTYTAQYKIGRTVGIVQGDQGLWTTNNSTSNFLSYPTSTQEYNQHFRTFGQNGSLSLWIKPLFTPATGGSSHVIFQMMGINADQTLDPLNRLLLYIKDGNQLEFLGSCETLNGPCQAVQLDKIGEDVAVPGNINHPAWKSGQWHHVTIVWSSENGMSLYLDGGLVARNVAYNKRFTNLPAKFVLGSRITGEYPFNGIIDDVRFFKRALSDYDVQQLFKKDYYSVTMPANIGDIVPDFDTVRWSTSGFGGTGPYDIKPWTQGTITVTYTVYPGQTIQPGGGIKIFRKLGPGNWEFSGLNANPSDPSTQPTARDRNGNPILPAPGQLLCKSNERLGSNECYYTLTNRPLYEGEKVEFRFNGVRAGYSAAENANFRLDVAVDPGGEQGGFYYELPLEAHPKFRVLSAGINRLAVIAPSNATPNQQFSFVVVAEDLYRNPVSEYTGTVSVSLEKLNGSKQYLTSHTFDNIFDKGRHRFIIQNFPGDPGPYILTVTDGARNVASNIIYASNDPSAYKLYWGDLHAHTQTSDGYLPNQDVYYFMREVANLDFAALGDHIANPGDFYNSMDFGNFPDPSDWQSNINKAHDFNKTENGKTFVTFPGYEYSQGRTSQVLPCIQRNYPSGPASGAYWSPSTPPFPSWPSKSAADGGTWTCLDYPETVNVSCPEFDGDWNVYFAEEVEAPGTLWAPNSFRELVAKAKEWEGRNPGKVLIVPHHGGRQANMDLISAAPGSLIPAVEITSAHIAAPCSFESWANRALAKGEKIGFLASSDNHAGTAGAVPGGFIGVWATGLSRQEIFEAIKARRIVAASRKDRPYIKTTLTVDGRLAQMGEEIFVPGGSNPTFSFDVGSLGGVEKVEIYQNERRVAYMNPNPSSFISKTYPDGFTPENGGLRFDINSRIYVKVTQKADPMPPYAEGVAWSSPIFVTKNSVTAVPVRLDNLGRPIVRLTFNVNPTPASSIGGETTANVVKVIVSDTPNISNEDLARAFATWQCTGNFPAGGKVICSSVFPDTGQMEFTLDSAFTGEKYIWATFHNDAEHTARGFWSNYVQNTSWSAPVRSGAIPSSFNISATAGASGTIYPQGSVPVNLGASQAFMIAPNSGYQIADVKVDNVSQGAVSSYLFENVTSNHTISATFSMAQPTNYTITVTAGAGGTISPPGPVTVSSGGSQTFTITPNTGYQIADVKVDNVSQGAVTTYTFQNVTSNRTISATFSAIPAQYTITVTAGANGTISPPGPVTISPGGSQTFTITPNSGYQIADVKVDNVSQGAVSSYPFTNVTSNRTISATFSAIPSPGQVVAAINCGSSSAYTGGGVTYQADTNAALYAGGQTYSTTAPIAGTTDSALYQTERFSMTAYKIPVPNGTYEVTLKFAELYCSSANCRVFSVNVEGVTAVSNLDLFAQVGKNRAYDVKKTVTVTDGILNINFTAIKNAAKINGILVKSTQPAAQYTITATAGTGGSISPSGTVNVSAGGSQTFTISPATGYQIADVKVNGASQGVKTSHTFSNVTSNQSIAATFSVIPSTQYTITATAGTGGSITPSGTVYASAGGSQTFTISPATGYQIADVQVNGASQGAKTSHTFSNVTSNQTITATFTVIPTGQVVAAINCGSSSAYTGGGVTYQADTNAALYTGGQTYSTTASITGTTDIPLYQTERFSMTAYKIPVSNGTYEVTLKFAELYCSYANCRVFGATVEGVTAVNNLDLFARVGKNRAYDVTTTVPVTDGVLNINFTASKSTAKINAILVKKIQ